MKFLPFCLIFFYFPLLIVQADKGVKKNASLHFNAEDSVPQYCVRFFQKINIVIDGNLSEKQWKDCEVITPLYAPWENNMQDSTYFRSCYDSNFFYFSFQVFDKSINQKKQINEMSVAEGDRVEMFFSADSSMSDYYCMEISPHADLLDYQASYHRIFNYDWSIKDAYIKAKTGTDSYYVEGKISIAFFKWMTNLESMKGTTIRVGIFRADKYNSVLGDFTWFSWVNLNTKVPDFHIPASLGIFKF